jgi:BirA family biotin operon repressor/biotin-[acetyl-CoA-carboxylase] ligase
MDPKSHIVKLLDQADAVVSGETLSRALGVSRVAVWKHIKRLVQSGVPIVASSKGYRLTRDPDSLSPWAFGHRRERIHYFTETSSTMDEATRLARSGCPDFSVAVALRQTHGRGRMQRTWLSADGGLYFTVVIRPDIPMLQAGLVNLAAAVDMADALRSVHQIDARLKWPNDLLADNRKICGILSQMEAEGEHVASMNIGIGLNVNNAPETEEPMAVSLKTLLGQPVPRRQILMAFLDRFEARMPVFDPQRVVDQWRSRNATLGQRVRVFTVKEMVEGTAVDVDAHGGLVLRLADGTLQTVIYGDCFHQ